MDAFVSEFVVVRVVVVVLVLNREVVCEVAETSQTGSGWALRNELDSHRRRKSRSWLWVCDFSGLGVHHSKQEGVSGQILEVNPFSCSELRWSHSHWLDAFVLEVYIPRGAHLQSGPSSACWERVLVDWELELSSWIGSHQSHPEAHNALVCSLNGSSEGVWRGEERKARSSGLE